MEKIKGLSKSNGSIDMGIDINRRSTEAFCIYKEIITSGANDLEKVINDINRIESPVVIMMMGLPASGKSTIARFISEKTGLMHLSTDLIRKNVLDSKDLFNKKVVGTISGREKIYDMMIDEARRFLIEKSHSQDDINGISVENGVYRIGVILDATFILKRFRMKVYKLVKELGVSFIILHVICSDKIAVERIKRRNKDKFESTALAPNIYFKNKEIFEKLDFSYLTANLVGYYFQIDSNFTHPYRN